MISAGRRLGVMWLLAAAALPAAAQVPRATPDTTSRDSVIERRLIEVASNLRCPVCQNLSILDSPSELAQDMKRLVREQLTQGRTKEEIEQYFIARYGEWVLLKPAAHGATLTVWLLPAAMLLGGGLLIWVAVRRWTRTGGAVATAEGAPPVVAGTPADLLSRRDALRRTLAELDEDFAEGKVTQQDYDALRGRDEAELAAVRAALKEAKAERKAATTAAADTAAATRRRLHPAITWTAGVVVFGVVATLSLRGAVRARSPGGTITGVDLDGSSGGAAAPVSDGVDPAQLAALEARVARDSNDFPALLELGHIYMRQQRLQPAADVSMKAVRLRPHAKETAEAFAHLGMILWGANELEAGLQSIDQALSLSPDFPEALLYKGIILFAGANDPKGAVTAWERYLQVAPASAETARVRGMLQGARQAAAAR